MLTEGRSSGVSHVEDMVWSDPKRGIMDAVVALKSVLERLTEGKGGVVVTTKWDGAPSLVVGRDDRGFFLSLKGAGEARRCRTEEDIARLYGAKPDLAEKMATAFRLLPSVVREGVYQGDYLFDRRHRQRGVFEGTRHIVFRPNTIAYAVVEDSRIGREIAAAEMGIVFHTRIQESHNERLTFPLENLNGLVRTTKVWMRDATMDMSGYGSIFEENDLIEADAILGKVEEMADRVSSTAVFLSRQKWWKAVPSFIASSVKVGIERYTAEMLMRNPSVVIERGDSLLRVYEDQVNDLFRAYAHLVEAKMLILSRVKPHGEIKTFMPSDGGFRATAHEGLVVTGQDGRRFKLIDRLEFSRNNASLPKEWLR